VKKQVATLYVPTYTCRYDQEFILGLLLLKLQQRCLFWLEGTKKEQRGQNCKTNHYTIPVLVTANETSKTLAICTYIHTCVDTVSMSPNSELGIEI
jgi:hypothetical protein